MKKLIMFVAALMATGLITATAATAGGDEPPPAPEPVIVCLNTVTTTLPAQVPYAGGASNLSADSFDKIEDNEANGPGGLFFAGFLAYNINRSLLYLPDFIGDTPEGLLNDGWSTNHATRGACVSVYVAPERMYVACYANWPNSLEYISGDEARTRLKAGTFRAPVASTSQVTNYPRGKHYLTCNAGNQKPTGRFVSTGNGGDVAPVNSVGAGLVRSNPLDWTLEVS